SDPIIVPQTNKARIDLVATLESLTERALPDWTGTLVAVIVLGSTMGAIWWARPQEECAGSLISALIVAAMFVCVYHNTYDLLLLTVPIAAAATAKNPSWRRLSNFSRWAVVFLLLAPFFNVFWTEGFRTGMDQLDVPWGSREGLGARL